MLFNSFVFIFSFLPIAVLVFFAIGKQGHHRVAIAWLVAASLFFYGWWNPAYLGLILASILFNYAFGVLLGRQESRSKVLLIVGVVCNLSLIAYYKYANFFIDNMNVLTGTDYQVRSILLPLAISFFTFQQIAYLVDAYKGETKEYNFLHYCLFVTFFPQLIAGPIVHHKEMLPQFAEDKNYRLNYSNLSVGLTIFIIGLFKKVILADGVAVYASPVFNAAEAGVALTVFEAWGGALAYTLQLYFDFSGYSDMAIGLARMIGIRLPLNFSSPYKANNIIEFWRRWHMTLSRFLRDYLYIPLGGANKGKWRRYLNLMLTMLLGGLWHGAGWTFVVWGMLHGSYLIINHAWRAVCKVLPGFNSGSSYFGRFVARLITFIAVVVGWVFFRAESFDGAVNLVSTMFGKHGLSLPEQSEIWLSAWLPELLANQVSYDGMFNHNLVDWQHGLVKIFVLLAVVMLMPNTQQMMFKYKPVFETYKGELKQYSYSAFEWSPSLLHALITGLIFYYTLSNLVSESEFLYFNF
jgi:D-alanyl-lipoteichoic acid acyltransferase DltB (MBOAT superfamily)